MSDLFHFSNEKPILPKNSYTAKDIEVLEGLEPVRKRPGMYIGGVDEQAMHHLVSEILDNSMDEAIAGFANLITIEMHEDNSITISDNGRGIPIDKHPKFPNLSALEVILTTLHSGGKFSNNSYQTAGGLHGVGISVVNALSEHLSVKVYRNGKLYQQLYSKGIPLNCLEEGKAVKSLKGTSINFIPDKEIFGHELVLKADKVYELAKSKAYLSRGVRIEWKCNERLIAHNSNTPNHTIIYFPEGVKDYLLSKIDKENIIGKQLFADSIAIKDEQIKLEWAVAWVEKTENMVLSYCNTIPTTLGGGHELGLKNGLLKSLKTYGEMVNNKKINNVTLEDILESAVIILSIFIPNPLFQGQTKDKLVTQGISKIVENIVKDHFDYWLSGNKSVAGEILEYVINSAEIRINRKNEKQTLRKTITQKLRLPGKLADCRLQQATGTELFIVEGDSAGGSAKQARDRETQAVLPLKGKILNVATSSTEKILQNQELKNLEIALGCKIVNNTNLKDLRYEKVIIMTDADVDGAHIASLLMTFFYLRMPQLIFEGHLYLACPPLYKLTQNNKTYYVNNDDKKNSIVAKLSKTSKAKIEVGRFKGLGEMTPMQLKETTMDPKNRLLLRVTIDSIEDINIIVEDLMGKNPEKRFEFIQKQAFSKMDDLINNLDI